MSRSRDETRPILGGGGGEEKERRRRRGRGGEEKERGRGRRGGRRREEEGEGGEEEERRREEEEEEYRSQAGKPVRKYSIQDSKYLYWQIRVYQCGLIKMNISGNSGFHVGWHHFKCACVKIICSHIRD